MERKLIDPIKLTFPRDKPYNLVQDYIKSKRELRERQW